MTFLKSASKILLGSLIAITVQILLLTSVMRILELLNGQTLTL